MSRGPNGAIKKKARAKRVVRSNKPAARPEEAAHQPVPMAQWPVVDCVVNDGWENKGTASVYILKHDAWLDDYAFGGFLVDLTGFGLKDGFVRPHVSRRYLSQMLKRMNIQAESSDFLERMDFLPCSMELAHQLIFGGILWAKRYHFRTPPEVAGAATTFLGALEEHGAADLSIFGREGKPLLMGDPETFKTFLPEGRLPED